MATTQTQKAISCPRCGSKARKVPPETVPALVKLELADRVRDETYRFCGSPGCDVVYFSESNPDHQYLCGDLRVRVGLKEKEPPIQVCYCFDWTTDDIEQEIRWTGTTTIPDRIRQKVQDGLCHCETMNPQGSCCLGNVTKAVREAEQKLNGSAAQAASSANAESVKAASMSEGSSEASGGRKPSGSNRPADAGCSQRRFQGGTLAAVGAVVSAVVASACCWLPLVLLAIGISGVGLAGVFESYRHIFLCVTFALLAVAFYLTYAPMVRRRLSNAKSAEPASAAAGHACCVPQEKEEEVEEECCATAGPAAKPQHLSLQRFNQVMLWIAAAVALVFAFFPNYVGALMDGTTAGANTAAVSGANIEEFVLQIEGMTCEGCAATVRQALADLPGVLAVSVNHESGKAIVTVDIGRAPSQTSLIDAVSKVGFRGRVVGKGVLPD